MGHRIWFSTNRARLAPKFGLGTSLLTRSTRSVLVNFSPNMASRSTGLYEILRKLWTTSPNLDIRETCWKTVKWIDQSQDGDQWLCRCWYWASLFYWQRISLSQWFLKCKACPSTPGIFKMLEIKCFISCNFKILIILSVVWTPPPKELYLKNRT
jgi:hypothetical protein